MTTKKKTTNILKKIGLYTLLLIGVFISVFPFYWMFIGATNPSGQIFSIPPNLTPGDHFFENLRNLNETVGIWRVMMNSLIITLVFTLFSVIICSATGYAFAKYKFKGREAIFFALLLAIMIPYHVTLIPLFQLMADLGWLNTYQAVILPNLAYPFAIFLMRQNMRSLPDSLLEATRVDGAGNSGFSSQSYCRRCGLLLRQLRSSCLCSSGTTSCGL